MLPQGRLSTTAVVGEWLSPDDLYPATGEDYEIGGAGLNDTSKGLSYRAWKFELDGNQIIASTMSGLTELRELVVVLPGSPPDYFSACFDENMDVVVFFFQDGVSRLRHYDATIPGYRITDLPGAYGGRLSLDDKRPWQVAASRSDVLLVYLKDNGLYYRQGRERFGVERLLAADARGATYVRRVGMADTLRLQIELAY